MEYNNIKVHKPWYARGTPIANTRDGPAMALSDKPLFAIRHSPSARGKPPGIPRPWLIFKTLFLNTQKRVFSYRHAQIRQLADAMIIAMTNTEQPKTRRVDIIIANEMAVSPKPQRGKMIIKQIIIKHITLSGFRVNTDTDAIILPSAKSGLKTKTTHWRIKIKYNGEK